MKRTNRPRNTPWPSRLLSANVIARLEGVTAATVRARIAAGEYAEVIYISTRDIRIPARVVAEWQAARTARFPGAVRPSPFSGGITA